jgi:hypothetical protein
VRPKLAIGNLLLPTLFFGALIFLGYQYAGASPLIPDELITWNMVRGTFSQTVQALHLGADGQLHLFYLIQWVWVHLLGSFHGSTMNMLLSAPPTAMGGDNYSGIFETLFRLPTVFFFSLSVFPIYFMLLEVFSFSLPLQVFQGQSSFSLDLSTLKVYSLEKLSATQRKRSVYTFFSIVALALTILPFYSGVVGNHFMEARSYGLSVFIISLLLYSVVRLMAWLFYPPHFGGVDKTPEQPSSQAQEQAPEQTPDSVPKLAVFFLFLSTVASFFIHPFCALFSAAVLGSAVLTACVLRIFSPLYAKKVWVVVLLILSAGILGIAAFSPLIIDGTFHQQSTLTQDCQGWFPAPPLSLLLGLSSPGFLTHSFALTTSFSINIFYTSIFVGLYIFVLLMAYSLRYEFLPTLNPKICPITLTRVCDTTFSRCIFFSYLIFGAFLFLACLSLTVGAYVVSCGHVPLFYPRYFIPFGFAWSYLLVLPILWILTRSIYDNDSAGNVKTKSFVSTLLGIFSKIPSKLPYPLALLLAVVFFGNAVGLFVHLKPVGECNPYPLEGRYVDAGLADAKFLRKPLPVVTVSSTIFSPRAFYYSSAERPYYLFLNKKASYSDKAIQILDYKMNSRLASVFGDLPIVKPSDFLKKYPRFYLLDEKEYSVARKAITLDRYNITEIPMVDSQYAGPKNLRLYLVQRKDIPQLSP